MHELSAFFLSFPLCLKLFSQKEKIKSWSHSIFLRGWIGWRKERKRKDEDDEKEQELLAFCPFLRFIHALSSNYACMDVDITSSSSIVREEKWRREKMFYPPSLPLPLHFYLFNIRRDASSAPMIGFSGSGLCVLCCVLPHPQTSDFNPHPIFLSSQHATWSTLPLFIYIYTQSGGKL